MSNNGRHHDIHSLPPNIPNTHYEQIDQFTFELQAMIHRYKKEWDLPLESIVGAMAFVNNEIVSGDYSFEFIPDPDFWEDGEDWNQNEL